MAGPAWPRWREGTWIAIRSESNGSGVGGPTVKPSRECKIVLQPTRKGDSSCGLNTSGCASCV